jgi:hypothetical protein
VESTVYEAVFMIKKCTKYNFRAILSCCESWFFITKVEYRLGLFENIELRRMDIREGKDSFLYPSKQIAVGL